MKENKLFYKNYHDKISEKRLNSPFPLRRYVHQFKYRSIVEKINEGEFVLDAGCGDGMLDILLAKKNIQVTACDISEPNIEEAIKTAKVENVSEKVKFIIADVEKLPFPDNSFDVVISSHVLEHVPNFEVALGEIKRVTKNRAIIAVPTCLNLCSAALLGGDNFWRFSKRSLFSIFFGAARILINLFKDGVNETYAGERSLKHTLFYPWAIRIKIKKAGFKIVSFEADTFCFPYLNFLIPVFRFMNKFKSAPILRNFGYGSLVIVEKD